MYSISDKVKPNNCISDKGYMFSYDGMNLLGRICNLPTLSISICNAQ